MRLLGFFTIAALAWSAAVPAPKERWATKYFFDEDQTSMVLTDLKFWAAKRGVAGGYTVKSKDRPKPVVLVTTDAGEHWSQVQVKEVPLSLFFLEDGTGWMVGEKNIWKTEESGRTWEKVSKSPPEVTRLYFINSKTGWAIGGHKQIFRTNDGGETWTPLAEAANPKVNPYTTDYTTIAFGGAKYGIISGWSQPVRRDPLPDWVDPKKAKDRPQWPTTLAFLQTADGGATWHSSTASIFGHMSRISMTTDGDSLGLIEFNDNFAYPSEVFLALRKTGGDSQRVFREANRFITDVLMAPGGTGYLAGVEQIGTIRNSPVPAKVKIFKSTDFKNWIDTPVDYKIEAHRVYLSGPDAENIWAATDTGSILKLVREP